MKRVSILVGILGIAMLVQAPTGSLAQTARKPVISANYENAASVYRVAVMQIFKRHMMALEIASNVDSPLDYNLVIHARALRETARMLEELPIPDPSVKDTSKFSLADQTDFLELVLKGIDAADEVYVSARLIRFQGRGRFDEALVGMKKICSECHRSFRDPYRKLQE